MNLVDKIRFSAKEPYLSFIKYNKFRQEESTLLIVKRFFPLLYIRIDFVLQPDSFFNLSGLFFHTYIIGEFLSNEEEQDLIIKCGIWNLENLKFNFVLELFPMSFQSFVVNPTTKDWKDIGARAVVVRIDISDSKKETASKEETLRFCDFARN
ncbi:hypothetical protein [Flavobacterium sp. FlaQc-47]|uniref:hypothetical protein n=1 Tax=Flavobacterium sp. FlaQc-47 TaxID=3374180 RepID=UPI003756F806